MSMNLDYKGIEIGELAANTSATLIPGRPVKLNASAEIVAATVNADVLGLVKEAQIAALDEVSGDYGIYGSGKASVVVKGIVTVEQSVINGVSYSVYNEAPTTAYAPMDHLYVNSSGEIDNAQTYTGITYGYIGMVLVPPTNAANGDPMQIVVE